MALIKCEECGKELSVKATTCIHCGCPIKKTKSKKKRKYNKLVIGYIIIAVLVLMIIGCLIKKEIDYKEKVDKYNDNLDNYNKNTSKNVVDNRTPKEKMIDYLQKEKNYTCSDTKCVYNFSISGVNNTDYYTIDFSTKTYSIMGNGDESSYYREFNWGNNKGYSKLESWAVLYSYITIDLTFDEENNKYSWSWDSTKIGSNTLCDENQCKSHAETIMDLYNSFVDMCNNAKVNKNDL